MHFAVFCGQAMRPIQSCDLVMHFPVFCDQVMGLRMLVDESGYLNGTDKEGGAMADRINAQLPPEVRVFAVQKVRACEHVHARMLQMEAYLYFGGRGGGDGGCAGG